MDEKKKYYILGGILIFLVILAGVVFFMTGQPDGDNNPTGPVQLVWWKPFENSENIQDLINDYQTTHKGVTITYVKKDINTYESELVDALASGQGPDIFSIHNDWLPKHLDKLSAVNEATMSLRTYNDTFVDVASSDFVNDNKVYAIPLSVDLLALYYNKDILGSAGISQPPSTWTELVADVEKITKISKPGDFVRSGVALGTSNNVNRAVDILNLFMLQNGTKFYSDALTNATFDQQQTDSATGKSFNPGALALQFYTQFANPSKTSYTWNAKSDFSLDAFTQGKVGMVINYQYAQASIKSKGPNLNWGVSGIPQISTDSNKINFANYWGESVSKASKAQLVAWDFLKFISSKTELEKYYGKHKQVSSRKDILPDQITDTEIGAFAENALTARSVYKKDANVFESVFLKMIDDVVLRNSSAEEAVHNGVQQINLNLQKR